MRRRIKRCFAILLAWVICISTFNVNVLAKETVISMGNTVSTGDSTVLSKKELPFCEKYGNVNIEFNVVNKWENGYQCEILLTNVGDKNIDDWQINFFTSDTITNVWNGSMLKTEEGSYSIVSTEYNGEIAPQGSILLGYCAEGGSLDVGELRINVTSEENIDSTDIYAGMEPYIYNYASFTVEYYIRNVWEENCNAYIKLINTSDKDIENWKLIWETEDIISNVDTAEMSYS